MRNLKRALSLTLASVMLLGMMVVGSSAAAGYDDVSETDNVEAIEVLQAIEVMVGDERGFGPERPVNRAEMAVVMGKLLSLDYNYYSTSCPFNDVYDWAQGWVGACAANGIVSGRGEGVYDPGATVTAVEAASMLMRALGYFKYSNDYADGFEVSTVRQGTIIGIFDGVGSSATEPMTRNQVAQMVLNALQSAVVEPDGNTTTFLNPDGTVLATTGKVNYVSVTSNKTFASAISRTQATSVGSQNDGWIVELGERLYDGKLKLTDTTDAFGRPSRYWEYDAKEIGTYVKEELIREEYTVKVTGRTLHDLLGSTILKDYDLDVYIDGVDDPAINTAVFGANSLVRNNENGVGKTGKGVLTQVFVDPDEGSNGLITIAIINTYLAIADEDFDDRTDDLDITVYGIEPISGYPKLYEKTANISTKAAGPTDESSAFKLETEDFPSIVDAKDGDAYLVTVADGEVQTIAKPEILSGTQITSFKQADWIVTGGTQYDFASAAEFEMDTLYDYTATDNGVVNLKDITYNVYLDKYGYAIGVEEVERVENYVFITGVDTNTVNRYAVQADASAIFIDGTMEAIKVDMKAARDLTNQDTYRALTGAIVEDGVYNIKGGSLVNKWFSYTVGNDGVYEVVLVGDDDAVENNGARAGQFRTLNKKDDKELTATLRDTNGNPVGQKIIALGNTHGVDEVGPKSIALRGGDEAKSPYYSVYGDDQSVYITAELETIMDANGSEKYHVNIISGVDSVTVGIDNASIDVWDEATAIKRGSDNGEADVTAYGSYVLFDDDGDVIAAVIVGEDSGAVTNLVYTHKSKIESETNNNASDSRASVKGDYTWTRKVVSNGEEILLTEVGSGLSKLKSMLPNTWYVVKYNAKGEVKNVYPAWDTAAYLSGYKGLIDAQPADATLEEKTRTEDQYVNNIEELNTATNENNLVLYEVGAYNTGENTPDSSVKRSAYDAAAVGNITWLGGPNNPENVRMSGKPYVDNHTLFITTQTNSGVHRGFRVADDVKTVFIQTNNREETTLFESGYSRLEKVIDRLHDHAEYGSWADMNAYHYEISAVMENGKASVIVIRDLNNAGATWDTVTYSRELWLYGNLFTASSTTTGASDTVVTVGDQEIKPSGIGTNSYGSYTIYSIPQGSVVSIVDYDIDSVNGFSCIYSSNIGDLTVRQLNRRITFTMPGGNAWIDGGRADAFKTEIVGKVKAGEESLSGKTITFEGVDKDVKIENMTQGKEITIVIRDTARAVSLEDGKTYKVTLGTPEQEKLVVAKDGALTIEYRLTGEDIRLGQVWVWKIEAYNGTTTPTDPSDTVAVTGVSLNKPTTSIAVDGTETLTATVTPDNATNKNVTWDSSDKTVATVSNGVVTGVKVGTATITVTTEDGSKTASCTVTVTDDGSTGPVTPTNDPKFYAKESGGGAYEFYNYKGTALSETDALNALATAVAKDEGVADAAGAKVVVASNGTSAKITWADGQESNVTITAKATANGWEKPVKLVAITYGATKTPLAYVTTNGSHAVEGLPAKMLVMSDAAVVGTASYATDANGKATGVAVTTSDVNLVQAVKLSGAPTGVSMVAVDNSALSNPAVDGTNCVVQASATLMAQETSAHTAKLNVSLKAGDKVVQSKVSEGKALTFQFAASELGWSDDLTSGVAVTVSVAYSVTIDGKDVEMNANSEITGLTNGDIYLVVKYTPATGENRVPAYYAVGTSTDKLVVGSGKITLTPATYQTDAYVGDNGKIALISASEVTLTGTDVTTVYDADKVYLVHNGSDIKIDGVTGNGLKVYVPTGDSLKINAKTTGKYLTATVDGKTAVIAKGDALNPAKGTVKVDKNTTIDVATPLSTVAVEVTDFTKDSKTLGEVTFTITDCTAPTADQISYNKVKSTTINNTDTYHVTIKNIAITSKVFDDGAAVTVAAKTGGDSLGYANAKITGNADGTFNLEFDLKNTKA